MSSAVPTANSGMRASSASRWAGLRHVDVDESRRDALTVMSRLNLEHSDFVKPISAAFAAA